MTEVDDWPPPVPRAVWYALRRFIEPYVGVHFTVPGEPVPKERRIGSGRDARTPERTRRAEKAVAAAFRAEMPGWQPEPDRTYGVMIEMRTKSTSRADSSNVLKLIEDGLNKVFWLDDIQVGQTYIDLVRHGEPGVEVWLFAAEPNGTTLTKLCECGTRFRGQTKICEACARRRAVVNLLLTGDDAAADAAEELDRQRRAAFSFITACTIGNGRAPSIAAIAKRIGVTDHRANAVVDTLIADGNLKRVNRRLTVIKPLGAAA